MPGATTAGGWGWQHQKLRAQWKPKVDAGLVHCHAKVCMMPDRLIIPGAKWHLGHTEDRTAWTGPEHERCNCADGGRRRGRPTVRRWTL